MRKDCTLSEAKEQLQWRSDMLRISFDAIIVWQLKGTIESWNRGAEQLYGYSEEEALGRVTHELLQTVHPVPWQEIEAKLHESGNWEGELRHRAKDGREIVVMARHQLVVDSTGIERVLETNRDITERKRSDLVEQKRAEEIRARLAAIVESSADAIVGKNLDGIVSSWNQSSEQLFGYSAKEMIGQPISRIIPPDREAEEALFMERLRHGEYIDHRETVRLHKSGHAIDVAVTISPIRGASGEILGISNILRDISDRKRVEALLHRQAALIDLTPDAFSVRSLDGTFTYWTRGAEELYGWTREEAIGQRSHNLFSTIFPEELEKINDQLRRTGSWTGELLHRTKDGREITVVSRWLAQFDTGGNVEEVLESNTDVTLRKHAEQQLRELNQQLEDRVRLRTLELETANKELEAFSYSVSHDLRSPLRTMDGFSQALLEDHAEGLNEKGTHYVNRIRTAAQKMGRLIDDLLQLSRLSRTEMRIKAVDLSNIAQSVINDLRTSEPDRHVEVHIEPGLQVNGDPGLLEIAMQNLLSNAWKFTSRRNVALIEVGKTKNESGPTYYVRDNGTGFDMQYAGRLFSPFQRLHSVEDFRGTGIGLATVQRILRRHHGRIWVEAAEEKGATFFFEIGI